MSKEWQRQNESSNFNSFDSGGSGDPPSSNSNGSGGGDDGHFFFGVEDDEDSSSDEEAGFFVRVETIMGNKFQVYAYSSDSVELLKTRIAFQEGIPQKDQNLFLSQGRIALNNPSTLLADLGINEATSHSKPFRLITNISSGIGSKGFVTRDSSPPPTFPPLPLIPKPLPKSIEDDDNSCRTHTNGGPTTGRRSQQQSNRENHLEPFRLPRLGLDEDDIDGMIVFKDREDRRIFVIIKKKPSEIPSHPNSNLIRGRRSTATMTGFEDTERRRMSVRGSQGDGGLLRTDLISGRRESFTSDTQTQLERIRENAKTLQKMTQIRSNLLLKKRTSIDLEYKDRTFFKDDRENQLPDINEKMNFKNRSTFRNKFNSSHSVTSSSESKTRITPTPAPTTFNRTITSSIASLNRLKAEIYLEGKKTGGGSFGVLPYTNAQLCKYVKLKVKVLLADQNPLDYDYLSPHRFVPCPEAEKLIPTVVLRRQQQEAIMIPISKGKRDDKNGRRTELRTAKRDSSSSTCASDLSVLKEQNNVTILRTGRNLKSEESLGKESSRLRKQQLSQAGLKSGGVSVRSIRSAGRRPISGSIPGSSSTIQKKKKDTVRCSECRKRIGLACRYQCHCGKTFCSTHRYAETHNCTFDYKTEGRRQLEEANPLIVANKVNKI